MRRLMVVATVLAGSIGLAFATAAPASAAMVVGGGVVVAVPLSGMEVGPSGAGNVTAVECEGLAHCVTGTVVAEAEATGLNNQVLVTFYCYGLSTPDPSSTTINCSFGGATAPTISLPGPTAATVGEAIVNGGSVVQICVDANATFIEAIAGPPAVDASGCKSVTVI